MATYLEIAAEKQRGLNWVGVNIESHAGIDKVDLTNLPTQYSDNQFDGIYSEHFIEHLYKYQGINFFKEAFRILKSGGVIRTVWPPYEFVQRLVSSVELTQSEKDFVEYYHQKYIVQEKFAPSGNSHRPKREQCALGLLYQKGQHLHSWGVSEMIDTLENIGFKDVKRKQYMQSTVPDFNNIDTPGVIRALHSAVIEARKPW